MEKTCDNEGRKTVLDQRPTKLQGLWVTGSLLGAANRQDFCRHRWSGVPLLSNLFLCGVASILQKGVQAVFLG